MEPQTLSGQVALVTGASRGIGRAIAEGLASRGASVAGMARTETALVRTMHEIENSTGSRTAYVVGDVLAATQIAAAVERVTAELGPVDILVNNAGLVDAAEVPMWASDPDQWVSVVASHIMGAYLMVRAVVPSMVERGHGRVVNLASGMGAKPQADYSAYSVGKAGQMRLTESLAQALAGTGVQAFNIAPGLVETDMTRGMPKWDAQRVWTSPALVVELVCSAASGELDGWSGRFLRAGIDTPETAASISPKDGQRQLRLLPYGSEDPLT